MSVVRLTKLERVGSPGLAHGLNYSTYATITHSSLNRGSFGGYLVHFIYVIYISCMFSLFHATADVFIHFIQFIHHTNAIFKCLGCIWFWSMIFWWYPRHFSASFVYLEQFSSCLVSVTRWQFSPTFLLQTFHFRFYTGSPQLFSVIPGSLDQFWFSLVHLGQSQERQVEIMIY